MHFVFTISTKCCKLIVWVNSNAWWTTIIYDLTISNTNNLIHILTTLFCVFSFTGRMTTSANINIIILYFIVLILFETNIIYTTAHYSICLSAQPIFTNENILYKVWWIWQKCRYQCLCIQYTYIYNKTVVQR